MPGTSPVIFILGAGPNIGFAVARTFASRGYKVALAARSLKETDSTSNELHIKVDFANTDEVVNAFTRVKKELGIPSVVLYNASVCTFSPPDDPFAISSTDFARDLTVNAVSVFVAAQQAVQGFAELPASAAKSFFYTGNITNVTALPRFMDQGAGKSASAHMMMAAAAAYKEKAFKWYYVDERKADGSAIYKVDGDAHGKLMLELAEAKTQGPWLQTFISGVGYKSFDSLYRA